MSKLLKMPCFNCPMVKWPTFLQIGVITTAILSPLNFAEELRLSHQVPAQHMIGKMMDDWAQGIEQDTQGDIDVKVFHGSQLVRSKSHISAVARGHLEAALISNHDWGQTLPAMGIFSRPFGFKDYTEFKAFLSHPAMSSIEQSLADKNMVNLGWVWVTNSVGVTSNDKPLVTPTDFNGLKIRSLNRLSNTLFESLGAIPVSLSGGEVYQALQSSLVQAAVTTLQGVYLRRYNEVQEWCVVSPLFIWAFSITVNKDWWEALTLQQQTTLQRHTAELEQQSIIASTRELATLQNDITARGMKVHVLSDAEIARQLEVSLPEWEGAFLQQSGSLGSDVLEAYNNWRDIQ